jgi:hypothetical protein
MKDNSAYMIRLELLKLAQSIEMERSSAERLRKEHDWHTQRDIALIHNEEAPPFPKMEVIDHIRIMQVARSLNEFVSKGD